MDETSHFCRNSNYIYRQIAGDAVLVPVGEVSKEFNGVATLNSTGAFIWELLEEEKSLLELSESLAKEYNLTEEQSRQDVTEFIQAALSFKAVIKC